MAPKTIDTNEASPSPLRNRGIDLTGQRFDRLEILGISHRVQWAHKKVIYWEARCDCGVTTAVSRDTLMRKKSVLNQCKDCMKSSDNGRWAGYEELSGKYFSRIQRQANQRDLIFQVSIQELWELYIKQGCKCSLTGLPIVFGSDQTASLDRVDSKLGYLLGNIQWVHKEVNTMKMDLAQDDFIHYCVLVSNNQKDN